MKKYWVYGLLISQHGVVRCESVYGDPIKANNPDEAIKQAVQWNIEESITGKYDAERGMILYFDDFGKIVNAIVQIFAVEQY